MKTIINKAFAFIVALLLAGLLITALRFIGPVIAGLLISAFNIPPIGAENIALLEATGNIFNIFILFYVGIKVYKKMTNEKK